MEIFFFVTLDHAIFVFVFCTIHATNQFSINSIFHSSLSLVLYLRFCSSPDENNWLGLTLTAHIEKRSFLFVFKSTKLVYSSATSTYGLEKPRAPHHVKLSSLGLGYNFWPRWKKERWKMILSIVLYTQFLDLLFANLSLLFPSKDSFVSPNLILFPSLCFNNSWASTLKWQVWQRLNVK